jgi:hypothetical protein
MLFQSFLDVRSNTIDGEYAWTDQCSWSGVGSDISVAPGVAVPVAGFGVSIAHNVVRQADARLGGAISIRPSWYAGDEVSKFIDNVLIYHNRIAAYDEGATLTGHGCREPRHGRRAMDIAHPVVWRTVLYANVCASKASAVRLHDAGTGSVRVCTGDTSTTCECVGIGSTDVSVAAATSATRVPRGGKVQFTVTVNNSWSAAASNVALSVEPGNGLRIESALLSASQGKCDPRTNVCHLGSLRAGASATVRVSATALVVGNHETVFSATQTEADMSLRNNGAVVRTVVVD